MKNKNDYQKREFLKKLLIIGLPITIQNVIAGSLGLVDNVMVGKLGEIEIGSVGVATQVFFMHWMVLFGFSGGTATYISQFWGVRDIKNIKKTIGILLTVCVLTSLIFFVITYFYTDFVIGIFTNIPEIAAKAKEYVKIGSITFILVGLFVPFVTALRTTQQTRIPLYISFATFGINTIFNYILIYGKFGFPKMGVLGAATATVIATSVQLIITLIFVFGKKNIISGTIKEYFSFDTKLLGKILKNASSTTANETLWVIGRILCIAVFARVGVTEYAAVQAGNVIRTFFFMGALSLGDVMLIMVGEKLGERKIDEAFDIGKQLIKICNIISIMSGLTMILMSKYIIGFFELSKLGEQYAIYIIIAYGATLWLDLYNAAVVTGILRAGGDTFFSMIVDVGTVWVIALPLVYLGGIHLNLPIYITILLSKMEAVVKSIILYYRIHSKKWLKNLIHDIS